MLLCEWVCVCPYYMLLEILLLILSMFWLFFFRCVVLFIIDLRCLLNKVDVVL